MPPKRRPGGAEKDDHNDRPDEAVPAKAEPTRRAGRKASLTDRLAGLDSPLGRRGYLGLLGATASLAAVAPARSAPSTTVDLGDEGLADGDRIDPYVDQFLNDGVEVVVPQGSYRWGGDGLHGKTFGGDAALVGDGQVTLERVDLPNHTNVRCESGTFRMENFTFRGDAGGGSASDDTRIRAECGSSGTIEFVNVRHPDGTREQSESEATAWYVPGAHGGTIRFIDCLVAWYGNNGIYASSPGHGEQGTVEVIGGFFYNNNIASIRVGGDNWLVKDVVIVHDQEAPSRIDSGTRMRGIRIDEGGQDGRIENVHISVPGSVGAASPPLENSNDSAGGSCTVQDLFIRNDNGDDCIDLGRASYDMRGDNLQLTGSGNLSYDGDFTNVCVDDGCTSPKTEAISGSGSSDGTSDGSSGDGSTSDGSSGDGSDGDGSSTPQTVVEVLSTNDTTEFDYEFDADGPVTRVLDAGAMSAETGNDAITDNGDGTYTVSGHVGLGFGDTFGVEGGTLTAFRTAAADGDYAVYVDGTEIDTGGSGDSGSDGGSDSGSDDGSTADEVLVEVLSTNSATEFDYELVTDGPVTRVLDAGDRSAESSNDDVTDNGDGTFTVSGHTGFGVGDSFGVEGTLIAFRPDAPAGDCAVYVDGTDVTSEHLLPNRIVIDGTDNGPSQYSFEVTGDLTPARGTGPLEVDDAISGSAVEGEVAGDVDAYYFSGDVVDYSLSGGATVVIEDIDG